MPMSNFHVRVAGDDLVFSAGHFLSLADGSCERLHGHTYRVVAEIDGPLDKNHCVVDFVAVRDALKAIVGTLDHHMLLPTQHAAIQVRVLGREVEASLADRRWLFPADDCLLLPIADTTTELLAQYVGRRLLDRLGEQCGSLPGRLRIEIAEGAGCSAIAEFDA